MKQDNKPPARHATGGHATGGHATGGHATGADSGDNEVAAILRAASGPGVAVASAPIPAPEPVEESEHGFRIFKPATARNAAMGGDGDALARNITTAIRAVVRREIEKATEDIVRDAVRNALDEITPDNPESMAGGTHPKGR